MPVHPEFTYELELYNNSKCTEARGETTIRGWKRMQLAIRKLAKECRLRYLLWMITRF